jgi:hypothetical protein
MGASLYEPINVYKLVAPNIGIVDGPYMDFDASPNSAACVCTASPSPILLFLALHGRAG